MTDSPLAKGTITEETSLVGEVVVDAAGKVFLAPEQDYRGGGMGSVLLFGCRRSAGDLVEIIGVFDRDVGVWAQRGLPFSKDN